jgi:CDGSH-type Zn-finger protein/uncharacterized Fe-S cluster protein YjdI
VLTSSNQQWEHIMDKQKVFTYTGEKISVKWDSRLCIHIGECGYARGELFVSGRDPWCQPDLVSMKETIDVVTRCPSGALSYQVKDSISTEIAATINTVQVAYNGPLYVQGDLDIAGATNDMPGLKRRAALCRCGLSKNKPYCDNSHTGGKFTDFGAVGERGDDFEQAGGKLNITALKDGPLRLEGNFAIIAASGRLAWRGSGTALCRCGQSKNKPFCDGSHAETGFQAE